MHSLIGMSIFLFGSSLGLLLMVALSTMPSYNGLNPLYAVYVSIILIGVGLFVMLGTLAYGVRKRKHIVDVPRAEISIVTIILGCLGFIWSYFSTSFSGCPTDGICWAVLQMPVASTMLSVFGAILLQTSLVNQGEHMNPHPTPLNSCKQESKT